ncbi:MAG: alpha/beta hydrolase [Lysobacterales bacterium]|jgi:pimeloyl-ACP methyl ester carboxylesterase|nr:MAG: alpha/beta hydrolase [Xanthomonadales bacterium]
MTQPYVPRRPPLAQELSIRGLRHHLTAWPGSDREPLVLLHGWMDTGDTFQFLVDELPARRRCVAPDLRGFGRSEWPADGYWFPDYLADLDVLLEHHSPEDPATLVGHSMGGNIAMLYAGIRPERVRRVVCIEGFGMRRASPADAPERYREWLRQLREPPEFAAFPSFEAFAHLLARRNPRLGPDRAAYVAQSWAARQPDGSVRVRSDPAHKRVYPVLYRREEAEACWSGITAPVLYVVAAASEFLPRIGEEASSARMAQLVPRLESCTIEDAGHMVHHERPERLAAEIEAFLERT